MPPILRARSCRCHVPASAASQLGASVKVTHEHACPANSDSADPLDADIIRDTGARSFTAGGQYVTAGRVRQLTISDDGDVIEAEIKGTAPRPYRQHIALRHLENGAIEMRGTCTCPMAFNCKHVAAAVIAARRTQRRVPVAEVPTARPSARLPVERAGPPSAEPPLPYELGTWLDAMSVARHADSEDYPAEQRQRVIYVLGILDDARGVDRLTIGPISATLRKDNEIRGGRPMMLDRWFTSTKAPYLRPSDRVILTRLAHRTSTSFAPDDDPPETLRRIIATGRARWEEADGAVITEGPSRPGRLVWRMTEDGSQNSHCRGGRRPPGPHPRALVCRCGGRCDRPNCP